MKDFPDNYFVPRFPLGRLLITPGARNAFSEEEILLAISRHQRGIGGSSAKRTSNVMRRH